MSIGPVILLVAIPVTFIGIVAFWLIHGIRKSEAKRVQQHENKNK